jgi:MFS family permease
LTALAFGALLFPAEAGNESRNHRHHHRQDLSNSNSRGRIVTSPPPSVRRNNHNNYEVGRGGYTNSNNRVARQQRLWNDLGGQLATKTDAVAGRFRSKMDAEVSNFFKSKVAGSWADVPDEQMEYGVNGDLLLPSQRALPPVVEELSYLNYLEDSGLVDDDEECDIHNCQLEAQTQAETTAKPSRKLEMALFFTYACNTFALSLPVILMPMVAAEHSISMGPKLTAGMFIAAAASISTLGGGVGKVINGFVCQRIGGRQSASLYLVGMGIFSFLLSINTSAAGVGWILAGLEFCASMQWTAHSILLLNHYEHRPIRFAAGMTTLSMASTFGIILAKVGGPALLHIVPSWRALCRMGAVVAVVGGLLAQSLVTEWPEEAVGQSQSSQNNSNTAPLTSAKRGSSMESGSSKTKSQGDLMQTFRHVLGSRLFWQAGVAHAFTSMARTSEKVLGSFFQDTTALSGSLCGGLTAFLTLGFLHGVTKGKAFHALEDAPSKSRMLRRAYTRAVMSAVGLALCANQWLTDILLPSKMVLAGVAALLSATMASSLSIQYYQIPTIVSNTFGKNKAVCLSLLDALAFFLSAPFLAATGQIVGRLGDYGWSTALTMLATLFVLGGFLLVDILPRALEPEAKAVAI